MTENKSSYKSIVKSTALFGGVKVVEVLITIIRTKIVAAILGPEGVGVQAIFNSTLASINQFSSLGIFQSSVREISQAHESGDERAISRIIQIVRRWIWIVGLIGALICGCCAKWLSEFSFGNSDYTWQFVILAVALLFWALSSGNITIMQGRRQLTHLARASLIGASLSLIVTIPLYYYFGVMGIAPALIVGYMSTFLVNSYYVNKIKIIPIEKLSLKDAFFGGMSIVKLGAILMFSNGLMTIFTFVTNAFISNYGTIADVGFFQAAFVITYGNLVILVAIMTADYYPRLSAVCNDKEKIRMIVNQQTELLLLIVAPISILLIIMAPLAVRFLYTKEFLVIVPMIRCMALALILRIIWHSLSYIILAKGDKKTYFIYDALLGNGINFSLNIIAYYFWGLQGLGFSFVAGSASMVILLTIVTGVKYGFRYCKDFWILLIIFICLSFSAYLIMSIYEDGWSYLTWLLAGVSGSISIYVLNKKTEIIKSLLNKIKGVK